jgi:hypothetical protein
MKRKIGTFILIAVLAAASLLTACGGQNGNESGGNAPSAKYEKRLLADFESKAELLSIIYTLGGAKAELAESGDYVTGGRYAAKITAETGSREVKGGDLNICFVTGTKFIPKTDYSDTIAFEVDIYNAYSGDIRMMFAFDAYYTEVEWFTVTPGKNHVQISIDTEAYDLASKDTLMFWLEGKDEGIEEPYVLYFDSFYAITSPDAPKRSVPDVGGKSMFRFENNFEIAGLMNYLGSPQSRFTMPRYSLNRDLQYALTGRGSMRVDFFTNRAGTGIDTLGFVSMAIDSSGWTGIDYDDTWLAFDLYNPNDFDISADMVLFTKLNETVGVSVSVPARSWSAPAEARLSARAIKNATIGEGLDIYAIAFYMNGLPGACSIYLDNISLKSTAEF